LGAGAASTSGIGRARGTTGMSASPNGNKLYPLLEGTLWDGEQFESVDGKRYLRVLDLMLKSRRGQGAVGNTYWKTIKMPSAILI
jgi:hypothetical protein